MSRALRRFAPELVVLAGAAAVLAAAGMRWATPLGDHGIWFSDLEAYTRGARLMRDIQFPYGPLSVAVLAALSRPFGPTVASVVAAQFLLGLGAAVAIVAFARRFLTLAERCIAAAILVATVFWIPGEGSLLYPYAPAVSIGLLFALGALAFACSAPRPRGWLLEALLAGTLGGLAYLTKQEIGAAAALGSGAAWLARRDGFVKRSAAGAAAFLATVAVGYAIVFRGVPFLETAREGLLWPFASVPASWRAQYAGVTGADRPIESFLAVAAAVAAVAALLAGAASLAALVRGSRPGGPALAVLVAAGVLAVGAAKIGPIAPFAAAPVFVLAALLIGAAGGRGPAQRREALAALAAASVPLLTRVGWRGWSDGPFTAIGYSLAIPVAVLAGSRLFAALDRPPAGGSAVLAVVAVGGILAAGVPALRLIGNWPDAAVPLSTPRGTVWVPRPWRYPLERVRDAVLAKTGERDSVLFLPETHGLSFLLARNSPAPGMKLYTGMLRSDEEGLVADLAAHPPVLVVVFDEDAQPFATSGFGESYGRLLERWLEARYAVVAASHEHGVPFVIMSERKPGNP